MQISTALFLQTHNASQNQKASPGEALKALAQGNEPLSQMPTSSTSLKEVVTTMLSHLAQEITSKSTLLETVQQSPLFKNLGNFSTDLQSLLKMLKSDALFSKEVLLFENFQKNIETIDAKVLKNQIQHSGLFLESALASKLTKEALSSSLKTLSAELKTYLADTQKTVLLAKELTPLVESLAKPQSLNPLEVQNTLKQTLALVRQSIREHLSFESASPLKESLLQSAKIENSIKELPLLASKIENSPQQAVSIIHKWANSLKEVLLTIQNEINTNAPTLLNSTLATQIESLLQQTISLPQASTSWLMDGSLREQLLLLANRLKQEISLHDPVALKQANHAEKSTLIEQKIVSLLKPEVYLSSDVMKKLSINPADASILGDIKGVLSNLAEKLTHSPQTQSTHALELTNKLLTQIEYHQLVSYVGSTTHVYVPFVWEGLKEGSMMMKQTSENAFHCQIDLDLEQYGKIHMMLVLSNNEYLDMSIATQKESLKEKVGEHLSSLKQALNEVGIITQSIKLLEYKEETILKKEYFDDTNLNFGINISV